MRIPLFNNISIAESLMLMRNLSITLRAGVPLARALALFEKDAPRSRRSIIEHLRRSVEAGHPLAQAMETAPSQFPALAVNLVRAGELGGTLEESLEHIVKYMHKTIDLRRKIRGAMMYPMFVLIAMFGLGMSIAILVLPELLPLFESLDVDLPWSTQILLILAEFFEKNGTAFVIVVFILLATFLFSIQLEVIKPYWHRFLHFIPFIGKMRKQAAIVQFSSTLSTLLKSGVHIREAIQSAASVTSNRVFKSAILETLPVIESGHTLSDGLKMSGRIFPEMTITLIEIGEETGTFAETLEYLAGYYEEEVDYTMQNLSTALEPMLLIGIGLLVGFTVLSIITPIYNVTGGVL